jgi:hypothetical protein
VFQSSRDQQTKIPAFQYGGNGLEHIDQIRNWLKERAAFQVTSYMMHRRVAIAIAIAIAIAKCKTLEPGDNTTPQQNFEPGHPAQALAR